MREPEGFREYVDGSRDRLVRAAWLLTGNLDDAEDLVQATLIKVWPRWQRISFAATGRGRLRAAGAGHVLPDRRPPPPLAGATEN
ncbi:MAG: hypothetical protein M3Z75_18955 [Actinomycetota bacterium]|nr:hypothetical protein [Actinomycetota bacterium]